MFGACGGQPPADQAKGTPAPAASDAKSEAKSEAKPDTKSDTKPDTKPEAKPEAKPIEPVPDMPKGRLSVAPRPDLAVVQTKAGVVAMDEAGTVVGTLVSDAVGWCRLDPRAEVLWVRNPDSTTLSYVDLRDPTPPVTVLEKTPETIVIRYPDEVLGRPEDHHFEDGLVVHMESPPRVEAILGCDGDMSYYCFGDEEEDMEAAHAKRLDEARKDLAARPFVGAKALATIVPRADGRTTIPPDPGRSPKPETVKSVPKDACMASPEDCGAATRLPGTRLWRVVVGNDRGDFFHETTQLYDPAAKVFLDPADPTKTSPSPLEQDVDAAFVAHRVSPSGTMLLGYDSLVKLGAGVVAKDLEGTCGFWGGGWELPTD